METHVTPSTLAEMTRQAEALRAHVHARWTGARHVLFLTGAGVSAASGVPTFRGNDGYWTHGSRNYHPQELATHAMFERDAALVWSWYLYRRDVCRAASPNPAHNSLAELEGVLGDRFTLVTQNVDGLHRRAGNSAERTFEIHGNIDRMRCSEACTKLTYPLPDFGGTRFEKDTSVGYATLALLRCPACSALARPHILWFDEYYDEELYRAHSALEHATTTDMLVVVGTSGSTTLPYQMVSIAERRGIPLVVLNQDPSPFTEAAERSPAGFFFHTCAAHGLPQLVRMLTDGVTH